MGNTQRVDWRFHKFKEQGCQNKGKRKVEVEEVGSDSGMFRHRGNSNENPGGVVIG